MTTRHRTPGLTVKQAEADIEAAVATFTQLRNRRRPLLPPEGEGWDLLRQLDEADSLIVSAEVDAVWARLMHEFPPLADVYRRACFPDGNYPDYALP